MLCAGDWLESPLAGKAEEEEGGQGSQALGWQAPLCEVTLASGVGELGGQDQME